MTGRPTISAADEVPVTIDVSSQDHAESGGSALGTQAPNSFRTVLSAALIILLPSAFWILVFQLINYMLLLNLSSETHFNAAMTILGTFATVWLFVSVSARRHEHEQ